MNNQEVFDTVAKHLFAQGHQSINEDNDNCVYRMEGGNSSCAVGCLIPNKIYSKHMEGNGIRTIVELYPKLYKFFKGVDLSLLANLQYAHDTDTHWVGRKKDKGITSEMLIYLKVIANGHKLNLDVVRAHPLNDSNWLG